MSDISRLIAEYELRDAQENRYQLSQGDYLFTMQQRERDILTLLKEAGLSLAGKAIFEMGCGTGGVLQQFLKYQAQELHGVDILPQRLRAAQNQLPHLPFVLADGQALPYASQSFDVVMQFVALSSLLDNKTKERCAQEMLRLCRPDGFILWYDFWLNPRNPQTKGIGIEEIRRLFPNCTIRFKKITLAPPLARRIVPLSWILALLLEKLSIFNSHYLAIIQPCAS